MIESDGKLSKREIITTFGEFLKLLKRGKLKRYNHETREGCEPLVRDYKKFMEKKNYNVGSSRRIGYLLSDSKKFKFKMKYSQKYQNTFNYYELIKE